MKKTILVPLDFSALSARVSAAAVELAKSLGGKIVLLNIVPPPPVMMNDYYAFDTGHMAQAMAAVEKNNLSKLREYARRCERQGAECSVMQAVGDPVAVILAKAKSTKASYIVMGSHGHGAVFDLLVGSTTHGVMRKAKCPVLVVPVGGRK